MSNSRKKIKKQDDSILIAKKREESYPVFCFKHLQDNSYFSCSSSAFFVEFLQRLKKLANLGWNGMQNSARHSYGVEKIPLSQLKPRVFPSIVTEEVKELWVLRAAGNNLPFLGIRRQDTFHVIFIETQFGDIYDHG